MTFSPEASILTENRLYFLPVSSPQPCVGQTALQMGMKHLRQERFERKSSDVLARSLLAKGSAFGLQLVQSL